ncbi:LysE family translocator [Xenorhabdus sp. IM139775]|uniref:LysE family translocator n=1 Tax=Xenorhabdus sp. IM139775 TaxID=3025876 RepID=UPI00235893DF|nr:LysE family transporter [Xenorhabdus sp. IM139775]MDC9594926.1 LysE family transporter [Xenorhabdus sp. IM139775]
MEIFLYTLGVMYSPGPVNFMGMNAGLTGQFKKTIGFFIGVGCAMFTLFILLGYAGEAIISHKYLPYISLLGALYTFYLSFKMVTSNIQLNKGEGSTVSDKNLTFWNGFLIQALNPKGILVVLPVTTIMYPAAHVTGSMILLVSILISIGGAGAPGLYSFFGSVIGKQIKNDSWLNLLNKVMGAMLAIAAIFMTYDFFIGINLI